MSGKVSSFDVNREALTLSKDAEAEAMRIHDVMFKGTWTEVGESTVKPQPGASTAPPPPPPKRFTEQTEAEPPKKKPKKKGGGSAKDMSSVKCFKCKQFGHYAHACPQKYEKKADAQADKGGS